MTHPQWRCTRSWCGGTDLNMALPNCIFAECPASSRYEMPTADQWDQEPIEYIAEQLNVDIDALVEEKVAATPELRDWRVEAVEWIGWLTVVAVIAWAFWAFR